MEKTILHSNLKFLLAEKNKKFDDIIRGTGLSIDNLYFLDFLQSDKCKQILINNKLKIHVETGNIYHDDQDTNELILIFSLTNKIQLEGL